MGVRVVVDEVLRRYLRTFEQRMHVVLPGEPIPQCARMASDVTCRAASEAAGFASARALGETLGRGIRSPRGKVGS